VLATRPDGEPEILMLKGRTSKGFPVALNFIDGELRSVSTAASLYCRDERFWSSITWGPVVGTAGRFEQDGPRFRVREKWGSGPRERGVLTLRGRLAGDGDSARGTIEGFWQSPEVICHSTVRFSAR
jgi:hypothetical protein